MKKIELGIPYVYLLSDFLEILKENDYQILREHGYNYEIKEGFMQMWIDDMLDNFCKPLIKYDKDTEIILEDK